jgi:hypothetical protein
LPLFVLAAAFAQSGYHQIKKITIGGEGGWVYLIAEGGRVYVSHTNEVDMKTHNAYLADLQAPPPNEGSGEEGGRGPRPGLILELPSFSNSDAQ